MCQIFGHVKIASRGPVSPAAYRLLWWPQLRSESICARPSRAPQLGGRIAPTGSVFSADDEANLLVTNFVAWQLPRGIADDDDTREALLPVDPRQMTITYRQSSTFTSYLTCISACQTPLSTVASYGKNG